jgi:hypothetical protein
MSAECDAPKKAPTMNEKPTMSAEEEYALTKRRKTGQASER